MPGLFDQNELIYISYEIILWAFVCEVMRFRMEKKK